MASTPTITVSGNKVKITQNSILNRSITGNGDPVNLSRRCTVSATVTVSGQASGTVKIEEAPTELYLGSWSVLATCDVSAMSGGGVQVYHLLEGNFDFVRGRISSAITGGGNVSVDFTAIEMQ